MGENTRPFRIQSWVGEGKLSQKMLGEIITWKIQGVAISHADLLSGLMASNLDCDVAKGTCAAKCICKSMQQTR